MKPTVVILLSDKRSGSTMFERELCKHPDINHVVYTPHSYNETHFWTMAACLLGDGSKAAGTCCNSYGSKASARQYMINGIQGNVPDFVVPDDDEQLVFGGWTVLCEHYAQPLFFEKSPQLIHRWDALELLLKWCEKTDFNVRFIGLVRNPMAVMNSAQVLFGTDPVERQYGWADSCQNLIKFEERVGSENFLLVKYENLIALPKKTFSDVCAFIGVEYVDAVGKDVHSRSLEAWRSAMEFTLQLDEGVAEIAERYGYSSEDIANPGKQVPSALQTYSRKAVNSIRLAKSRLVNWYLKPLYLRYFKKKL